MHPYLLELGATIALEAPILALLCRDSPSRTFTAAVCINLVSHPLATLCLGSGLSSWIGAELSVLCFETLALQNVLGLRPSKAFGLAALANAITAGLGLGMQAG